MLSVRATDDEEGPFGVVQYALSSVDATPNYNHFAVDSQTGDITVQHELNFITQSSYRLAPPHLSYLERSWQHLIQITYSWW